MTSTIQFPAFVIGLMSGTSADGVDAALLHTDGKAITKAGASLFVPYYDALRADILALMRGVGDEQKVSESITDVHIRVVNQLIKNANVSRETISLVGFHGQTIRHAPAEGITVQIGNAARMAKELGIAVVADFRSNDVKHGGQGAPLVPLYHAALANELAKPVMVVNIGGVSNVTWIGNNGDILAFDSGPGNALLDDWVSKHTGKRYDADGALAAKGRADMQLVEAFLNDAFFAAPAPKSLDRNQFNGTLEKLKHLSPEDGAATLTRITAAAIARSFDAVPAAPKRLLVCGGGRHNPVVMHMLKECAGVTVEPVESVGWDGDMLEAQAFAYLAARSVQQLPLSLPTTTGVNQPVTGGVFYPGVRADGS